MPLFKASARCFTHKSGANSPIVGQKPRRKSMYVVEIFDIADS